MMQTVSKQNLHITSVLLGALGGGILVLVATKAIPTMLSSLISAMMGKMISRMEACSCNPQEVCQKMMAAFAEVPKA